MEEILNKIDFKRLGAWFVPLIAFWVMLEVAIHISITEYFHQYYFLVFIGVFIFYYLSFRLDGNKQILIGLGLSMLFLALTLSFRWSSGFSDNFLISGLLPYKDAKNYYQGANQILNGLPVRFAVNAIRRPLFSGFLSSLLWLAGQDLKIALAILAQLIGIGIYLSARQIRLTLGALAGTIYITFSYFYIQFVVGYIMSESLGFILGCFAFVLLWNATQKRNWFDLLLGLGVLLMAVIVRAGAFFIFPFLILWAGWAFRGQKRYSLPLVIFLLVTFVASYYTLTSLYPRSLGISDGLSLGNFSFSLYGQVRGGIGWHSAIDELGTSNPTEIYQATWEIFRENPSGFFTGVKKAYIDFFRPGGNGIFEFGVFDSFYALDLILWAITIGIILRGLYFLASNLYSNISSLLLAGFLGILFSIPFLPPIDGGGRFYVSTMPFFFVLLAVGVSRFTDLDREPATGSNEVSFIRFGSVFFLALTVLFPPITLRTRSLPELDVPVCSSDLRPFVINIHRDSYIDLWKGDQALCGLAPKICFDDFLEHNTEMQIDDFYQSLVSLESESQTGMRIIPTLNLLDGYFQYFVTTDVRVLQNSSINRLSGCATRIPTENQRIFKIEMISSYGD